LDKSQFRSERIQTHVLDQGNEEALQQFVAKIREQGYQFDIIIDDGSHISEHQMLTLKVLWPLLRSGGLYIVEDLHTSYRDLTSGSAYAAMIKWQQTNQLVSKYIPEGDGQKIAFESSLVDVWKREYLPLKCWKCLQAPVECGCQMDLINEGNGSITSRIVKK